MCCEMPQVYGCETRKARKDHKCHECGGVIRTGEQYHYHHGVWDGSADSFKVCLDCDALRDEINKPIRYADERVGFGQLYEFADECGDETRAAFVAICDKRGGKVGQWMREKLSNQKLQ